MKQNNRALFHFAMNFLVHPLSLYFLHLPMSLFLIDIKMYIIDFPDLLLRSQKNYFCLLDTVGLNRSASEPTFLANNHKISTGSLPDNRELDSPQILNNLSTASEQGWDTGFSEASEMPPSPNLHENHPGFLNNFTDNMCTSTTSGKS